MEDRCSAEGEDRFEAMRKDSVDLAQRYEFTQSDLRVEEATVEPAVLSGRASTMEVSFASRFCASICGVAATLRDFPEAASWQRDAFPVISVSYVLTNSGD
jgi:hypothetical protein